MNMSADQHAQLPERKSHFPPLKKIAQNEPDYRILCAIVTTPSSRRGLGPLPSGGQEFSRSLSTTRRSAAR